MSSPVPLIQPPGHYMYHVSTEADYQTVMITWWPSWKKTILREWTLESKGNLKLDVYIAPFATVTTGSLSSRTCSWGNSSDSKARPGGVSQARTPRCYHLIIAGSQGVAAAPVCHPQVRRQADQTHNRWEQAIMIMPAPNSQTTSNDASLQWKGIKCRGKKNRFTGALD